MKIEAVIVCVDYADYLAETLPRNLPHFDRVIVVTSPKDRETVELCRRLSVQCFATDVFTKDGKFNKARGIDYGLGHLRHNDWAVQLDADTYLPPLTRHWLENKGLDPEAIYGVDRVNCLGWARWKSFLAEHHTGHDYNCRTPWPADMPPMARIALMEHGGFVPIGFFQLWHTRHGRRYPFAAGTAERDDVLHSLQWSGDNRRLLPEVVSVHLQAASADLGANWQGRTTPRFGPPSAGKPGKPAEYAAAGGH
jgi:hypothetical protein